MATASTRPMRSRIQTLRRQIVIYRRALRNIENIQLWETYAANLASAEAELNRLNSPGGAEFLKKEDEALRAKFGLPESGAGNQSSKLAPCQGGGISER